MEKTTSETLQYQGLTGIFVGCIMKGVKEMPKGSSGKGESLKTNVPTTVKVLKEVPASESLREAVKLAEAQITGKFRDLRDEISAEFSRLKQEVYEDPGVLGYYSSSDGVVSISNKAVNYRDELKGFAGEATQSLRGVVTHEIGHSLSIRPRSGYNNIDTTFEKSYKEYTRTNRGVTEKQFAETISVYAGTARAEAFAEAFTDYTINGGNAKATSKLLIKHWKK